MMQNIDYENFLNLESLIKDSQRNTEQLLELYFRLANEKCSDEEADDAEQDCSHLSKESIVNVLRSVQTNLVALELSVVNQLNMLK